MREEVVHDPPTGFVGIGDGVFRFVAPAIDVRQKEHLVAWTAREVTRAYRAHRNLFHEDAATEEKLVDITAVFLGLGVLMANEALRRHAESHIEGRMVRTTRWETQVGVLSPVSLCWLLAAQVTARGRDEADRIASLLHSEPRDSFRRAMSEMGRSDLRTRLGLPAVDPAEPSYAELETWAVERVEEEETALPAAPRAAATRNAGRRVFRVLVRRTWAGAALGALVGIVFTAYAIRGSVGLTYLVPLLGTIVGGWLGRTQRSFVCSDPQCMARLEPSFAQCPSCGGDVSGEIARASDRLAAEEELERRTGGYRDRG